MMHEHEYYHAIAWITDMYVIKSDDFAKSMFTFVEQAADASSFICTAELQFTANAC